MKPTGGSAFCALVLTLPVLLLGGPALAATAGPESQVRATPRRCVETAARPLCVGDSIATMVELLGAGQEAERQVFAGGWVRHQFTITSAGSVCWIITKTDTGSIHAITCAGLDH